MGDEAWAEAAREGALADLAQAVRDGERAQARIASLRAVLDALAAVSGPGGGLVLPPEAGSVRSARAGRVRVLLDAEPGRRWKAPAIGEALGLADVRSLRGTLQRMAGRGEIQRDAGAWYWSRLDGGAPAVAGGGG